MEGEMGHGLFSSVPTFDGKWQVALLNQNAECREVLPCVCETKEQAERYAKAFIRLFIQ
jgi:hypothetical protein